MPNYRLYIVLRDITSPHGSMPDRHYQIRQGGDGVVYCTCPGWRFRQTCRHLVDYSSGATRPGPGNYDTWINHNRPRELSPYEALERHELDLQDEARVEEERANARAEARADSLREGSLTRVPETRREQEARPRARVMQLKSWAIYEDTKLLGTMQGTSKEAVLGKIHCYGGKQPNITIREA